MRYLRGSRWRPLLLISFISLALGYWAAAAQEPKEKEKEAPKSDSPAAAAAPAEATPAPAGDAKPAEAPPAVPDYFSGADPKKWPDPTGGAAGVWGTPAGDGKGDVPSKFSPADVADRM